MVTGDRSCCASWSVSAILRAFPRRWLVRRVVRSRRSTSVGSHLLRGGRRFSATRQASSRRGSRHNPRHQEPAARTAATPGELGATARIRRRSTLARHGTNIPLDGRHFLSPSMSVQFPYRYESSTASRCWARRIGRLEQMVDYTAAVVSDDRREIHGVGEPLGGPLASFWSSSLSATNHSFVHAQLAQNSKVMRGRAGCASPPSAAKRSKSAALRPRRPLHAGGGCGPAG